MATNSAPTTSNIPQQVGLPPYSAGGFVQRNAIINFTGSTYSFTASGMTGVVGIACLGLTNAAPSLPIYCSQSANSDGTVTPVNAGSSNASITLVTTTSSAFDALLMVISRT